MDLQMIWLGMGSGRRGSLQEGHQSTLMVQAMHRVWSFLQRTTGLLNSSERHLKVVIWTTVQLHSTLAAIETGLLQSRTADFQIWQTWPLFIQ